MDDQRRSNQVVEGAGEKRNGLAQAGLGFGIASVFLFEFGIVPLLAIVLSGVGIAKVKNYGGAGKLQAWVGLLLGALYLLVNAYYNGHFG